MDVAALNLAVNSDSVKQATVELKAMAPAASAAERAAQRWGLTTSAAARSTEDFSKRVQRTIRDLEFERRQLSRTTAEKERYAILKRAGVAEASAEGRAIAASVAALQAQRAALDQTSVTKRVATGAASSLTRTLTGMIAAYVSLEAAQRLWQSAMSAGDLGEQAEQVGVNTDQLQAYRLAGAQAGIAAEQMDTALTKLARTMGSANEGNKEAVAYFEKLGVKILDANGQMRPVGDTLPEVASGLLKVGSSSERTALLMEGFGKSGAKMSTVLEELAKGNDALIASARQENAIISPAAIAAWDTLGDRLTVTRQKWATLIGEFGAQYALPAIDHLNGLLESTKKELEGIASLWKWIMGNMGAAARRDVQSSVVGPAQADVKNLQDRLDALRQNPTQFGFKASEKALMDQIAARQGALARAQALANQTIFEMDEADARRDVLPAMRPPLGANTPGAPSVGFKNPPVKAGGGSDPYAKALEGAREYILTRKAETEAIGQTVLAAARLKHEQDLLNKATGEGRVLSDAQKSALKDLAGQMAEADNTLATAKFMDDALTKGKEFIAQQQIERDTLYMTTEAAMAYRLEREMLNQATSAGIVLTAEQIAKIQELAGAQSAAAEQTRKAKEWVDFERETFKGLFADINQGLREGKSVWDALGNAAMNALNKISDKLMSMVAEDLFNAAFGGKGGGGGGGLGGLIGSIFGGAGGVSAIGGGFDAGAAAGLAGGFMPGFANGGAFRAGNVIPFARGDVFSSPTFFPMSRGRTGLMGEAGPEAIMPLRRGRNGKLGVEMSGGGAGSGQVVVTVTGDTDLVRVTARDEAGRAIAVATPSIVKESVKKSGEQAPAVMARHEAQRGGEWRD